MRGQSEGQTTTFLVDDRTGAQRCRIAAEDRYIDCCDVRKYDDLSPSGTAGNNWPEVRLAGGNGSEDAIAEGWKEEEEEKEVMAEERIERVRVV